MSIVSYLRSERSSSSTTRSSDDTFHNLIGLLVSKRCVSTYRGDDSDDRDQRNLLAARPRFPVTVVDKENGSRAVLVRVSMQLATRTSCAPTQT